MAIRTTFTAGEVLTAADLTDTFGAKANLASPTFTGTVAAATVNATGDVTITKANPTLTVGSTGDAVIKAQTSTGNVARLDLTNTASGGRRYTISAWNTTLDGRLVFQDESASKVVFVMRDNRIQSQVIYDTTSSSGANVFVETAAGADQGILKRSTSSIKYKTDVEDLDPDFADKALELRPVWFRSTSSGDVALHPDWSYYGLIAEEVAEVEPRLVHWGGDDPENPEPEGVQYDRLVVHILSIVQRQQDRITALEARLDAAGL